MSVLERLRREHGADVVKLFPASMGGPAYLEALRGPFRAGGGLVAGGPDETTRRAAAFVDAVVART